MNLLIYFAFPISTILLSIVFQKILKCPILVSFIFLSIYLILTFAVFDLNFLIATFAYTLLAFLTASIVKVIKKIKCVLNKLLEKNLGTTIENVETISGDINIEDFNGNVENNINDLNLNNGNMCPCWRNRRNTRM